MFLNSPVVEVIKALGEGQQHFKPAAWPRQERIGDARIDVCLVIIVEKMTTQSRAVDSSVYVIPNAALETVLV
jgi:hypothetical protein